MTWPDSPHVKCEGEKKKKSSEGGERESSQLVTDDKFLP